MDEKERKDLERRIHAVWLILGGAGSRGSKAWFAQQTGMSPRTIHRWIAGDADPYRNDRDDKGVQAILWLEKQERKLRKQLTQATRTE